MQLALEVGHVSCTGFRQSRWMLRATPSKECHFLYCSHNLVEGNIVPSLIISHNASLPGTWTKALFLRHNSSTSFSGRELVSLNIRKRRLCMRCQPQGWRFRSIENDKLGLEENISKDLQGCLSVRLHTTKADCLYVSKPISCCATFTDLFVHLQDPSQLVRSSSAGQKPRPCNCHQ
jgi:hypothetical protein